MHVKELLCYYIYIIVALLENWGKLKTSLSQTDRQTANDSQNYWGVGKEGPIFQESKKSEN
jgi:hypothetical protein